MLKFQAVVGLSLCVAFCAFGCATEKPAAAPSADADPTAARDAELTAGLPSNREDVEACRDRILNEGLPSTGGAAVEGADLAQVAEQARKNKDGKAERAAYFDLLSKSPGSPYVPFAYFEFAELFKAEAATDATKLPLAEDALNEVLKHPAPKNRLYLVASYRLAQTYAVQKKDSQARDAFQHAIDDATTHGEWDCAMPVAEAARRAYEQIEKPEDE
jgi:predicted negative regulator of RcsB-dependent stress response